MTPVRSSACYPCSKMLRNISIQTGLLMLRMLALQQTPSMLTVAFPLHEAASRMSNIEIACEWSNKQSRHLGRIAHKNCRLPQDILYETHPHLIHHGVALVTSRQEISVGKQLLEREEVTYAVTVYFQNSMLDSFHTKPLQIF